MINHHYDQQLLNHARSSTNWRHFWSSLCSERRETKFTNKLNAFKCQENLPTLKGYHGWVEQHGNKGKSTLVQVYDLVMTVLSLIGRRLLKTV